MNGGGWWWPGFLIQLAVFLTLIMGFIWWATHWALRHIDKRIDEQMQAYRDRDKEDM